MKPIYLKKSLQTSSCSFLARRAEVPFLYDKWHYHEELELLYVIEGVGTRFVGDSFNEFKAGDMVLVGSNLPHVWKNDAIYYDDESLNSIAILVQFAPLFMGKELFTLPEMSSIKNLMEDSARGVKIKSTTAKKISPLLEKLVTARGANRILLLIEILNIISNDEYELLSSHWFSKSYRDRRNKRINKVYDYVMTNFQDKISLDNLAGIANMNNTALCRYFKATTGKTITEFINEVRINYAYNLITSKDYSIIQACYESGFNNLSYFYRQFQKIVKDSPSNVIKKFNRS